jgi:large subunit ribosomal protein LP0
MPLSPERKAKYFEDMTNLLDTHGRLLIVAADNVRSSQMQRLRVALRGMATLLMGKNTLMRKVITKYVSDHPGHPYQALLPIIMGNVGILFIEDGQDMNEVRRVIDENRIPAPARVGGVAPINVYVEPGPTGCDPGQTAWFQALNIPTKINRGQIEIISRVHLIPIDTKVSESQAALLQKLSIEPFAYQLLVNQVYDNGAVFSPKVLDLTDDDIVVKFMSGVRAIAAIGLAVGYPTVASLPHSLNNAFKRLIAVAVETEYTFPKAEPFKEFLANPSAFAVAAPAAGGAAATEEVAEEEEEEEESADDGGAAGLFGDDDDDDW